MVKDNIFLTLGKYKYNPNKGIKDRDEKDLNEEENYFTEAFKLLLSRNKKLAKNILVFLDKKDKLKDFNKLDIKSQYKRGKIPDITITCDEHLVFIENKLNSKEREDQLNNYLTNSYVAYITLNDEKLDPSLTSKERFLGHYGWYQIETDKSGILGYLTDK